MTTLSCKSPVKTLQGLINTRFHLSVGTDFGTTSPGRWTLYLVSYEIFGAQTKAAVADVQVYMGQSYTGGAVGNTTWDNLNMCY